MESVIKINNVSKDFRVPEKVTKSTFLHKLKSVFYRKWLITRVLHDVSFDVNEGEFVGYVGPNGAGKSTTIKLLTGVLTPSSGEISVLGFNPTKQRYQYTYNIGVVFGQKSLLDFDLPVIDSFLLYKDVYELSETDFKERLDFFSQILKIDELFHIPVRKLSLGQRMRCEIAASLLHKPKVVFLDEPTIGLDAIAKEEIRNFLREINKKEKVTIILTTHDMDDIEALCNRIIVLDKGKIIYDGEIGPMKKRFIKHKTIEFELEEVRNKKKYESILEKASSVKKEGRWVSIALPIEKYRIGKIVESLLSSCDVHDLKVHEPNLEAVIREIYRVG